MGLSQLLGKPFPVVGKGNKLTWTLLKSMIKPAKAEADIEVSADIDSRLSIAVSILHECFEPLKDPFTEQDIIEDVVFSRE